MFVRLRPNEIVDYYKRDLLENLGVRLFTGNQLAGIMLEMECQVLGFFSTKCAPHYYFNTVSQHRHFLFNHSALFQVYQETCSYIDALILYLYIGKNHKLQNWSISE